MDFQVMPPLSAEDFAALKADILARGVQVWVEYDEHGNILDGHHRVRAVEELRAEGHDVAPPGRHVRKGLSETEKRAHARALNLARRHLDQAQKRALIADQLRDTPERSDRQIAAGLEVSDKTVGATRRELEDGAEIPQLTQTIGADGKTRETQRKPTRKKKGGRPRKKAKDAHIAPEVVTKTETLSPEKAAAVLNGEKSVIASLHTGDEESYTPPEYIESVRSVMGAIDLDPATCPQAQQTVMAGVYYTSEDDGLSKDWAGRVWMNPPYTARVINLFLDKLREHFSSGEITQAIVLTNNNTDTSWFHKSAAMASAICFTRGRINFIKPDESRSSPTNGQCFFYFGSATDCFAQEFSKHGLVMVRHD